jgi:GT2 family glycosyltransferase
LLELIRLEENLGFGQGSNIGAERARGRFLVFLNNDAFVTPNWLGALIGLLEKVPCAGGAGPRFIWPDGRLQEAGSFMTESGDSIQVGRNFKPYDPREEFEVRIVDYCSAACLAVPKTIFAEVGGFDPVYQVAYYEDVDLCFKILAKKKFIYYCPDATVVHLSGMTATTVGDPVQLAKIITANRDTFLGRWGDLLRARAENVT